MRLQAPRPNIAPPPDSRSVPPIHQRRGEDAVEAEQVHRLCRLADVPLAAFWYLDDGFSLPEVAADLIQGQQEQLQRCRPKRRR